MRVAGILLGLLLLLNQGLAGRQTETIDAIIRTQMDAQQIPGLAVAVIRRGEIIKALGYGLANVEHKVPVTDQTMFQSGSIGKQFTAAAIMLQVDDSLVALADPLSKFFPDGPPAWNQITVHHLLTHTSGIPEYNDGQLDYRRDYTEDELVKFAQTLSPEFPPGADWRCSNAGYILLGAIVRKASGKFYGDVLRERVFAPLGMTTARVISEADIIPGPRCRLQVA
jgi:CubicO group peptidase (beta-lactamase class C family)